MLYIDTFLSLETSKNILFFPFNQSACLVGMEPEEVGEPKRCVCCARTIEKRKLDLSCTLKDFSFLGSGYPLYFSFLKYCTIFLSLILIFSGGFNMITNALYGNDCKDSSEIPANSDEVVCKKNWITLLSLGNKHDKK